MKFIIYLFCMFFCASSFAMSICSAKFQESNAFNFSEADFTSETSKSSMKSLQSALKNKGTIGACELSNALTLIEGQILKLKASNSLKTDPQQTHSITKFNVINFCEFIELATPCE